MLKKPAYDPNNIANDIEYIAHKLDITVDELNSYLKAPNKTYRDYKNQDYIYNFGSNVMRMLGLEKGGKR